MQYYDPCEMKHPWCERPMRGGCGCMRACDTESTDGREKGRPAYGDDLALERDLARIKDLLPEAARGLLPTVEEVCDRMEYEGSLMFDEYPDKTELEGLVKRLCDGEEGSRELVRMLLLMEMFYRRCRRRSC